MVGEVATLAHEISDNTVEAGTGVSESLLPRTESTEVFSGLGDNIGTQFHDNTAGRLAADGDIEVNFGVAPGYYWR